MKKQKLLWWMATVCLMGMLFLCACRVGAQLENMAYGESNGQQTILWQGRSYLPYEAVANSERGRQIGFVDGDRNDQVYEYKGHSPKEWVVSFYHSGEMDGSMLMREESVAGAPDASA